MSHLEHIWSDDLENLGVVLVPGIRISNGNTVVTVFHKFTHGLQPCGMQPLLLQSTIIKPLLNRTNHSLDLTMCVIPPTWADTEHNLVLSMKLVLEISGINFSIG